MKECVTRKVSRLVKSNWFTKEYEIKEVREHEFISNYPTFNNNSLENFYTHITVKSENLKIFCKHCGQVIKG